jgi:5'-nucleotidase
MRFLAATLSFTFQMSTNGEVEQCTISVLRRQAMHILITNDDGVQAPGLLALVQAFKDLGTVTVLAPDRNWSASGHAKTMHRPLRVRQTRLADGTNALTTDGSPSDCVALAVLGLVQEPLDLVVSGINPLANVGHDMTYSGTVTAALEAGISGLPGFACSVDPGADHKGLIDYAPAAAIFRSVIAQAMDRVRTSGLILNINVPLAPSDQIKGVAITRQGIRVYRDALVARDDPRGEKYYWIGGEAPTGILDSGTDFWALANGYVSVTPLSLDLTAATMLPTLENWDLKI